MGNRTAKAFKVNGIRYLDGMKMRKDYRHASVSDDHQGILGICLADIRFHQNSGVDINAQVSPLS